MRYLATASSAKIIKLSNGILSRAMSTDRQLKITELEVSDVRFPTSFDEHGSDASHPAPDYSAVYVKLITNSSKSV